MAERASRDPNEPVVVYVGATPLEAEVVRAKLESYGLTATLARESIGRVLGLYIDGWGETRVLVPAEQAAEARAILEENDTAARMDEGQIDT